jgi:hypothetical protein
MPSSDPTASLADVHDDRADEMIERSSRISSPARDNEPRDTATKTGVAGARELMLQQRQESLRLLLRRRRDARPSAWHWRPDRDVLAAAHP